MNLFEKLTQEDIQLTHYYFESYGRCITNIKMSSMEDILRFWSKSKENLYKMFGEQFILEKDFTYEKPEDELEDDMYRKLWVDPDTNAFARKWEEMVNKYFYHEKYDVGVSNYRRLHNLIHDYRQLVDNIYDGDTFTIELQNKKVTIPSGCKAVKAIGKISNLFGIDKKLYEEFRINHSLVLNQKRTKGKLCLSILPMDYVTMSDNEHGWSSCMAWMEAGDYRMGTVEMMNSPYCIVAYIKSTSDNNSELQLGAGYTWNSKKWRQLILVTPELILGNKQYPYFNDAIEGAALQWVRELANQMPSYGPYMETACLIENNCDNYVDGVRRIHFDLDFDYMYNDIYDGRTAYFSTTYDRPDYYVNYSGAAICINCGAYINYGDIDPRQVCCPDCSGEFKCSCCGEFCDGDVYFVDGNPVCGYCYENETFQCPICEDIHLDYDGARVYIGTSFKSDFNWRFSITVCPDCLRNNPDFEDIFGEIIWVEDRWGKRECIDVNNITEENLEYFHIGRNAKNFILKVKNAKNQEEVNKITEEFYGSDYLNF